MKEIFERRSVRSFLEMKVKTTDINTLLKAAMRAPSAGNEQPWEFVVLTESDKISKITEFNPYAPFLKNTPCVIVVCGNMEYKKFPEDYWIQDCSAATQNILLEAVHLGLGGVWLGIYPLEDRINGMKQLLNLPENVVPLCAVALGYPKQQTKAINTFDEDRIHIDKW